jgi:alcohol dehydrogenase
MKALVYHGPGQKAWEEVPDAAIQESTDVVVRVDTTTICGRTCIFFRAMSRR